MRVTGRCHRKSTGDVSASQNVHNATTTPPTTNTMWLSRVKCGVLVGLMLFELKVRLCPMGDEVLAMRSLELCMSFECFFDVVMKVLMFIELVSGVKYPKIITVGFVLKRPFVDVLSSCRSFWVFFLLFILYNFFIFLLCLELFCLYFGRILLSTPSPPATCESVSRFELQSSLSRVLLFP